jgi:polyribonucleotide nucleotidyltransferase
MTKEEGRVVKTFYGGTMLESISVWVGGKELTIQTGKMAKQANGSVAVRYGDTIVLSAVTIADTPREGVDFFPLTVEYREKTSAAGRFPGGYIKREGRPTEKEILTCRLGDRTIRPLFPKGMLEEVQIVGEVLSADDVNDPDILTGVGASAALMVSDIPFGGPIGMVRVGKFNGTLVVNPTHQQMETSALDLVIAGTEEAVTMVEGWAKFASEETLLEAIMFGHAAVKEVARAIRELGQKCGKPKAERSFLTVPPDLMAAVEGLVGEDVVPAITIREKAPRNEAVSGLRERLINKLVAEQESPLYTEAQIDAAFREVQQKRVRELILKEGRRADGRGPLDIRPIACEVGLLPRTHGSALFTRGETQALAIATLGTVSDEQRRDTLIGEQSKRFMVHYNFPPFSVGEVKPIRGPSRRDIGHGILAERALTAVTPDDVTFPYTIRITSDILESNGSSSMATVCGGSLALMDAGVPVSAAVAGVAMGLIKEENRHVILADILGIEDALGEMDFKVAGTRQGITAFQMDIKGAGITREIMAEALQEAKKARLHVLDIMDAAIDKPRPSVSVYAPKITIIHINPEKIGAVIGPGGSVIRSITSSTGAVIDIEDSGKITIASTSQESSDAAVKAIQGLTAEVEVGKVYRGTVKNIVDFGAFVEILPGKEGLVHISRLADHRVERVEDIVRLGDEIMVKVTDIDDRGRINLSRRDALGPSGGTDRPDAGRPRREGPPDRRRNDRRDDPRKRHSRH